MPDRTQSLTITNRIHRAFVAQPVSTGVPWPQGMIAGEPAISLRTVEGEALPVAAIVLNRWPDGSVQWTLLDLALDLEPSQERRLLVSADGAASPIPAQPVQVTEGAEFTTVTNGKVTLSIGAAGPLVHAWTVDGKTVVEPGSFDLVISDEAGREFRAGQDASRRVSIEHRNSLRAVIRADGKHTVADGTTLLNYWLKFTITAGRPDVKVAYHFRNREEQIPGVKLRDIRLVATLGVPADAERAITQRNRGRQYFTTAIRVPEDIEIISSDTPLIDQYAEMHVNGGSGGIYLRQGDEVLRQDVEHYPWFLQKDANSFDPSLPLKFRGIYAERALWPYLGLAGADSAAFVLPLNMTGLHPKSLRIDGNALTCAIWPAWAGLLSVRQGVGKTHEFVITGLPAGTCDFDFQTNYLSWENAIFHHAGEASDPIGITPDIAWMRACKVFHVHFLPEYDPDGHFRFERKWAGIGYGGRMTSPTGTPSSGMWNFGDYALICNNDNMASLRHLQDYLRSGNWDHARRALNACQHVIDVDYVDYSIYPYQHHGMVAHCVGHNNGAVYPSHEWISDLFIAYAISGDPELKTAALNMCENVLYWVNDPDGFSIVSADHREAGQPMVNLTWAYAFNPDPRYLQACEKIVRDVYMKAVERYGRLVVAKPDEKSVMALMLYGDWACWKGMFYYWELTRDEALKAFFLKEVNDRVCEGTAPTGGDPRAADVDMAAYAYYLTGDPQWIHRLGRVFKFMFDASVWEWTWEHGMYYCKLAFDEGIITDDDVRM